ncbi:MAG: hypothetical protein AB1715_06975 [Acidobacteriota bacterium]
MPSTLMQQAHQKRQIFIRLFFRDDVHSNASSISSTVSCFSAVQFVGLGFLGSRLNFFHSSAATRLVKKAHDSQDRGRGNDHPFCPCSRPPEYDQNNNGCSQQKPAETKLHDFTPSSSSYNYD